MNVRPLARQHHHPVGLVTGPKTVRGEWSGRGHLYGWDRVPRGAVLFMPTHKHVWPLVEDGKAIAHRWKNHGIVSVTYDGRRIVNLRGLLDDLPIPRQLEVLVEWADWIRSYGANLGSPAGSNHSLWRSSLEHPIIENGDRLPLSSVILGARQDMQKPGVFENVELWDLAAAYSHTLGSLELPRKWRRYDGPRWADTKDGFARAVVRVPSFQWGPLPYPIRHSSGTVLSGGIRMLSTKAVAYDLSFPVGTKFSGVWTNGELRTAVADGCEIEILEGWTGVGWRPVFAEWWQRVIEARETLSPEANRLVKWGANTLWGRFAANGSGSVIWYESGERFRERETRKVAPQSVAVAGLVAGRVRERLYREALSPAPLPVMAIACHTDGVFLPAGFQLSPNGGDVGTWRVKRRADRLWLIGPQTYALDMDGERHYTMAGIPPRMQERLFKSLGRRADIL